MMCKQIIVMLIVLISANAFATANNELVINLESDALQESRKILVRLPVDYDQDKTKHYPVLYTLNDEDNFGWASYIVNLQASRFGIEDMIVVGLPHTGNYGKDNYPFKKKGRLENNPQALKYAEFITEEALPTINDKFRTNGGRYIVGHSLSGLFVSKLFIDHNQLFSAFFVISPSVHHAPQMVDAMKTFLINNPKLSGALYLSIGDIEHEHIQEQYTKFENVVKQHAPKSLQWESVHMSHTDHLLAAFNGTYGALAWLYKDYTITTYDAQKMNVSQVLHHYETLSQRLGYQIKPRKRFMTSLGWFLEQKVVNTKAALSMLEAAQHFYPDDKELEAKIEKLKTNQH